MRMPLPGEKAKPGPGVPSYHTPPETRLGAFEDALLVFSGSAAERCDSIVTFAAATTGDS